MMLFSKKKVIRKKNTRLKIIWEVTIQLFLLDSIVNINLSDSRTKRLNLKWQVNLHKQCDEPTKIARDSPSHNLGGENTNVAKRKEMVIAFFADYNN